MKQNSSKKLVKIKKKREGSHPTNLRPRLLLLLLEKSQERHTRNLHNLESNTRNITHGVTFTSKSSNQNFILKPYYQWIS
jgi:hypothetical protein